MGFMKTGRSAAGAILFGDWFNQKDGGHSPPYVKKCRITEDFTQAIFGFSQW
jgi:hypothetical protein